MESNVKASGSVSVKRLDTNRLKSSDCRLQCVSVQQSSALLFSMLLSTLCFSFLLLWCIWSFSLHSICCFFSLIWAFLFIPCFFHPWHNGFCFGSRIATRLYTTLDAFTFWYEGSFGTLLLGFASIWGILLCLGFEQAANSILRFTATQILGFTTWFKGVIFGLGLNFNFTAGFTSRFWSCTNRLAATG